MGRDAEVPQWSVMLKFRDGAWCWSAMMGRDAEVPWWGVMLKCRDGASCWSVIMERHAEVQCWKVVFAAPAAAHTNLHHQSTVPTTGVFDQCTNNCAFGKGPSNFRTTLTVLLGKNLSLLDTCYVVGAVHLYKCRPRSISHLLSVNVTQVRVYQFDTCCIPTTGLYLTSSNVSLV